MTAGDGDKPQKLRFFLMEIHGDPAKILASSNVALGHELASRFFGGFFSCGNYLGLGGWENHTLYYLK